MTRPFPCQCAQTGWDMARVLQRIIERVKQMGLQKWIDQQLHPELIDDSAVDARIARFPTLQMSSSKLLNEFPATFRWPRNAKALPSRNTKSNSRSARRKAMQAAVQGRDEQANDQGQGNNGNR